MNINDISNDVIQEVTTPEEALSFIFQRQTELHRKYKPIEEANGVGLAYVKDLEYSVDNPQWQYILKDYSWRITEELTEALEAWYDRNHKHELEELIDALHFYTELMILCQVRENDIIIPDYIGGAKISKSEDPYQNYMKPIYNLGLACNLLKNKPWKNSHLVTDSNRFYLYLSKGYNKLLALCMERGLKDIFGVYKVYIKKSEVNKFRIDSNY